MTTKEDAVTAARNFADRSGKYALYSAPYGDLTGNMVSMVVYTSTPKLLGERQLKLYARAAKKGYLAGKGRFNESRYWECSHIVQRTRIPGTHHIELVTVKLKRTDR